MKLFSKKYLVIFLVTSLIIGASGTFYTLKKHPRYFYRIKQYVSNSFNSSDKTSSTYYFSSKLKRDSYNLHRQAGEKNIDQLIEDGNIKQMIKNGKLVNITKNNGYKIHKPTYSKPLLTPIGYSMLKEIGNKFAEKTNNNDFFVVTSLTRTLESQKKLSKHNPNATKNISSHSYGSSFDISYTRFNNKGGHNPKLQKILEDILISFQQGGKIYVLM